MDSGLQLLPRRRGKRTAVSECPFLSVRTPTGYALEGKNGTELHRHSKELQSNFEPFQLGHLQLD